MNDRDKFALAALSGLLASNATDFSALAYCAYKIADDMIAARNDTGSTETTVEPEPKPEPKFKIGDRVRLIGMEDEVKDLYTPYLGQTATVRTPSGSIWVDIEFESGEKRLPYLKNLELVTEKRPFQVGDVVARVNSVGEVARVFRDRNKVWVKFTGSRVARYYKSSDLTLLMTAEEVNAKVKG